MWVSVFTWSLPVARRRTDVPEESTPPTACTVLVTIHMPTTPSTPTWPAIMAPMYWEGSLPTTEEKAPWAATVS